MENSLEDVQHTTALEVTEELEDTEEEDHRDTEVTETHREHRVNRRMNETGGLHRTETR
jgi:hypothetical protein